MGAHVYSVILGIDYPPPTWLLSLLPSLTVSPAVSPVASSVLWLQTDIYNSSINLITTQWFTGLPLVIRI